MEAPCCNLSRNKQPGLSAEAERPQGRWGSLNQEGEILLDKTPFLYLKNLSLLQLTPPCRPGSIRP